MKKRLFLVIGFLTVGLYGLGPIDELIIMIKSHNNQDNIMSYITGHPETANGYVSGYTPLMHAIFESLSDVAERLIRYGVDIYQQDRNELATALMYAVSYDLPDTVNALIKRGVRLTDKDRRGRTVWDYVHEAQKMERPHATIIQNMLEQHAATSGKATESVP